MCGIAGMYHLQREAVPAHRLTAMCDAMRHRGPDDEGYVFFDIRDYPLASEGYWVEKGPEMPRLDDAREWRDYFSGNGQFNFALGHRRLKVIDLTDAAHQPMSNRANGIWLSYNGEIYNFRELRSDLERRGHRFFSQSDTEVVIHLYETYGIDAIRLLNGIFSFALWDGRENRLILARDRYGAKPLYYTIHNDVLYFASEVKALLQCNHITAGVDERAVSDYFTFQNTFGERTLFKNIKMLEAGYILIIQNDRIHRRQYWDFAFENGPDRGEDYCIEQVRTRMEQAVRRQLVADVPIGSYLSGGMDSASITAIASRSIPRLMSFTGGFDLATAVSMENFFDERKEAELLSRTFGTEHYQMVIHAGDLQWALPKVIFHAEDLRVGMSYPHYYLSRLAGKFVTVVLAGAGGDEIFAGYPWRYGRLHTIWEAGRFETQLYRYWSRLVPEYDHRDFFGENIRATEYSPRETLREVLMCCPTDDPLKKALYFDARTFLHGILVIEDKLSMAHSLESRLPFLDNELVDFALQLPNRYLFNETWSRAAGGDINLAGKYIMRRAMQGILPDEIVLNRKQGFSAPDQSWYMNQLVQYVRGILLGERSLDRRYFRREYVERVLEEHIKGRANHRLLIWSLLSFEWWNRIFIDKTYDDAASATGMKIEKEPRRKLQLAIRQPRAYTGDMYQDPGPEGKEIGVERLRSV
jgi:asparagine synthase (glutamine-hydrolysing)